MPRFYFDISDGDRQFRDDEGDDLVDMQAVGKTAIGVLPDIARDVLLDGDRRDLTCSVRNEAEEVVFRAKLALTVEYVTANDP